MEAESRGDGMSHEYSWQARMMKGISKLATQYQQRHPKPLGVQRKNEANLQQLQPLPTGVTLKQQQLFGRDIEILQNKSANKIIMYLHGGAYQMGSNLTHRPLTSQLAIAANADVYVINYRLAPETPFPGALIDAIIFYQWLQTQAHGLPIHLAGDSAGGGLALATLASLRDKQLALPVSLSLLSPWADLSFSLPRIQDSDPIISQQQLEQAAHAYAGTYPRTLPKISPIFEAFHEFPPTFIQVGSDEFLLADSVELHKKLLATQIDVHLKVFPQMWHVFQLASPFVPESQEAISALANFIEKMTKQWYNENGTY